MSVAVVPLHEGAKLLKERLEAVMKFKKGSRRTAVLSILLTGVLAVSGAEAGAYSGPVREAARPALALSELNRIWDTVKGWRKDSPQKTEDNTLSAQAERYYETGSLPLFGMVFPQLSEEEQQAWMDRFYQNDEIAFFSVAVNNLEQDSPLLTDFAGKAYGDGYISFFSVLADEMPKEELKSWLDRALQDEKFNFQSSLYGKLGMEQERNALEAELDRQRLEEYAAHGITKNGKKYYYKGELVNIFVDRQQNRTVYYTLEMNPAGTVNLKVTRDGNGRIQQVETMTQAEAEALLREMEIGPYAQDDDDLDDWDWEEDDKKKAELEQRVHPALGVTTDGEDYYYQGTLVRIYMDQKPNGAFYVLEINPAGTVDLKTVRDENGRLLRVERMTQAEAEALLRDMEDDTSAPEDKQEIMIPVALAKVEAGAYVSLGIYPLEEGDQVCYHVSAETGDRLDIGFADPEQGKFDVRYYQVSNQRQNGTLEIQSQFTWESPVAPGEYRLFIHTTRGALANVNGQITILKTGTPAQV